MAIEIRRLCTHFFQVSQETTVRELIEALAALPSNARAQWYTIVQLNIPGPQIVPAVGGGFAFVDMSPGYAVLLPLADLPDIVAVEGMAQLDVALGDLPGLLTPARMIERTIMEEGRARRDWLPGSPRRRLVVLEAGQVVGLLTDELRAGGFGGLMTTLFGREHPPIPKGRRITVRCPVDGGIYDFAEVLDLATNRLICPQGHVIEE